VLITIRDEPMKKNSVWGSLSSFGRVGAVSSGAAAIVALSVIALRLDNSFWNRHGFAQHAEATEVRVQDSAHLGMFTVNVARGGKVLQVEVSIKLDPRVFRRELEKPGFRRLSLSPERRTGQSWQVRSGGLKKREKEAQLVPSYLELYIGRLRDALIHRLSSMDMDTLARSRSDQRLRDELLEDLNRALGVEEPVIEEVSLDSLRFRDTAFFRLSE
jgi:flagellar basal body-associated protein FliL